MRRIVTSGRGSRPGRGAEADRGAALIEFVFVLPVLLLLVLGIVEFGIAWNEKSQTEAAVRAGGRIASASSRSNSLTVNAAAAVGSALKALPGSEPKYVMVYRVAPAGNGNPPAACAANCSKFLWTGTDFATGAGQDQGGGWPASAQNNNCTSGVSSPDQFDQVGVYVNVDHPLTLLPGFIPGLPSSVTLEPHAVFRLEPTNSSSCG